MNQGHREAARGVLRAVGYAWLLRLGVVGTAMVIALVARLQGW